MPGNTWAAGTWLAGAWLPGSWGDQEAEQAEGDDPFAARRSRRWRPGELEPLDILPPRKRSRRRRRDELLVIGH